MNYRNRDFQERLTAYLFLLPDSLGLIIFLFVPIVYAFYISFFQWDLLTEKTFIGLENYVNMLSDKEWWDSVLRTLNFAVIYVPTLFALSLLLAVLIHSLKRNKTVFFIRTAVLMPFAITSVISSIIWMFMLDPRQGYINRFLNFFGIENQQFLGSTSQAMVTVAVVMVWINVGYNMIIFLSALNDIPNELYEAAKIDGAGPIQVFRSISFPMIRETSVFILVVSTIASFQVLEQILVMTKGGPASATEVSVIYIYKQSFALYNMGYGSALSFVLFLIIFTVSMLMLRLQRKNSLI